MENRIFNMRSISKRPLHAKFTKYFNLEAVIFVPYNKWVLQSCILYQLGKITVYRLLVFNLSIPKGGGSLMDDKACA